MHPIEIIPLHLKEFCARHQAWDAPMQLPSSIGLGGMGTRYD